MTNISNKTKIIWFAHDTHCIFLNENTIDLENVYRNVYIYYMNGYVYINCL